MKYKPYIHAFKIGFARELAYPVNFFLGRTRNVILLVLMYYIWSEVFKHVAFFSGVSVHWFITYVFVAHVLRSFVIGGQFRDVASEITSGAFSRYLVQPIRYGLFHFFQNLSQRLIHGCVSVVEVLVLCAVFSFSPDIAIKHLPLAVFVTCVASLLYFLLVFTANLFAFWSREAMGPLFFFDWFMEFASGSFFPLFIVGSSALSVILLFPFPYTLYVPTLLFLQGTTNIVSAILLSLFWIFLLLFASHVVFQKGLRQYTGDGL